MLSHSRDYSVCQAKPFVWYEMLSRHGTGNNINIRVGFMASEKSGRHFADIFKWIFANDNVWILIKISLMFAPKSSVPALVQIMAWFLPGDKPLSEPAMIRLPTHICVIRPQWVNKQRVLMHGHQGWNVRHGLCHIYMIYVYVWVVYSFRLFCCLFIIVTTQFVPPDT